MCGCGGGCGCDAVSSIGRQKQVINGSTAQLAITGWTEQSVPQHVGGTRASSYAEVVVIGREERNRNRNRETNRGAEKQGGEESIAQTDSR